MDRARLDQLEAGGVAFDTETYLVIPGNLAPPMVCGSVADKDGGHLLDKDQAADMLKALLAHKEAIIIGANIAYDFLVVARHLAAKGENILPDIFRAYDEGRVFDVLVAEALHAIAIDKLGKDPLTGEPFKGRYSLALVTRFNLGREAKENDEWRLRYGELDDIPLKDWPESARIYPVDDANNTFEVAVYQAKNHANLQDLSAQCYAAWFMHLGAAWGLNVNPEKVEELESSVERSRHSKMTPFVDAGLLRANGKKDQSKIKKLVAQSYGAVDICRVCLESGKMISAKSGKPIICKACDGTGFNIDSVPEVPRTDTGRVSAGRDILYESGSDILMDFAAYGEDAKITQTYTPWLRTGIKDGSPIPLTLSPNVLVSTGRTSYSGVVQLLPRKGGVRECIEARPGYVYCSCDYSSLELSTHAQSCLWLMPDVECKLADAINNGVKPHDLLASQMIGVSYEDFLRDKETDPTYNDFRQAAKAGNFGFPGGMGAPKFVVTKRGESGITTTGPNGRVYRGLRLCILIGGKESCGQTKVTRWGRTDLPPTCKDCIECAERLRSDWLKAWPENNTYFDLIADTVDNKGYVIQHVTNRKRAGVTFCSAANSYFQGLAADGGKAAGCKVAKEQYCDPDSPLYGSRIILFAHDELFLEIPEDKAVDATKRLRDIMVSEMRKFTPDVAVDAEPALMRVWSKDAHPVYKDGILVPWEPDMKST